MMTRLSINKTQSHFFAFYPFVSETIFIDDSLLEEMNHSNKPCNNYFLSEPVSLLTLQFLNSDEQKQVIYLLRPGRKTGQIPGRQVRKQVRKDQLRAGRSRWTTGDNLAPVLGKRVDYKAEGEMNDTDDLQLQSRDEADWKTGMQDADGA